MIGNIEQIFTHRDLDGAGCALVYSWFFGKKDVFPVTNNKTVSNILKNYQKGKNIAIFDLFLRDEFLENFDKPNVFIVDHHGYGIAKEKFKKATVLHKNYSSNTLFLYKIFKKMKPDVPISENKKKLVLYIDDYDSGKQAYSQSVILNTLFWNRYKTRFGDFLESFKDGYRPLDESEKNLIRMTLKSSEDALNRYKQFAGEFFHGGDSYSAIAYMGEKFDPIVMDTAYLFSNFDFLFFFNTDNQNIVLRKKTEKPVDIGEIASKYCDGYGQFNTGYGRLTPAFEELSKNLKPYRNGYPIH